MELTKRERNTKIRNTIRAIEGLLEDITCNLSGYDACPLEIQDRAFTCLSDLYKVKKELLWTLSE